MEKEQKEQTCESFGNISVGSAVHNKHLNLLNFPLLFILTFVV